MSTTTDYIKLQLEQAFGLLNTVMNGVTEDQYNWSPSGTCNPASKAHVHALSSIDFFTNGMLKGGAPTWGEVASKTGLPENAMEVWKSEKPIPLQPMQEYGQKVQKMALDYVSSLSDEDLKRELDSRFFGKQSVSWILQLMGMHTAGHAGEISTVKGMQGLKGLPF